MARRPQVLQRFDIVEVTWNDCREEDDWLDFASYRLESLPVMQSVGYFYGQDRDSFSIFRTMDETIPTRGDGLFDGVLTIYKRQLKKVRVIRRFNQKKVHAPKYHKR